MPASPSYTPSRWTIGVLSRKLVSSDPKRVLVWLGGNLIAIAAMIVVCAVIGEIQLLAVFAIGEVVVLREAIICGPRAWRATKATPAEQHGP